MGHTGVAVSDLGSSFVLGNRYWGVLFSWEYFLAAKPANHRLVVCVSWKGYGTYRCRYMFINKRISVFQKGLRSGFAICKQNLLTLE